MTHFNDMHYARPDLNGIKDTFEKALDLFRQADNVTVQLEAIKIINAARQSFSTMESLCSVRYTVDTTNAFYESEQDYFDENRPILEGLVTDYYKELLSSTYKPQLIELLGETVFKYAEMTVKTFKPEILEDLQLENKLKSQYTKLKASAKIQFQGEERTLEQMYAFTQVIEREGRKAAHEAMTDFYKLHEADFDQIYDELVKVRHQIALKLGYDNFVPLAYARLGRSDYDSKMVANYRNQVFETVVPVANQLRDRQSKRLQLDALKYYDFDLEFLSGNATPKGTPEEIIELGRTMYKEMSPETHDFFEMMVSQGLMDLVSKPGKAPGGYCTYFADYKVPFIFSNFNGTSGDVDVLTHEAGHAFQVYSSLHFDLPEYHWPTLEACEIHSMSMEFFAWPWMELFFKDETDKYKFMHLTGAILFIPYGVAVDEFQHGVYENPNMTPNERKGLWRSIEKKYLPKKDYDDNEFLEKGGFWFRQGHIFQDPFYYIDYTLAQVCALEFWAKSREHRDSAWQDYLKLCQTGGSKTFVDLVEVANLHVPFNDGTIGHIFKPVVKWLDSVQDNTL